MNPALLTAVVTAGWVLVEGAIGGFLLGRNGRPYKIPIVVLHAVLFLPVAAGWVYTVNPTYLGVGSWIAEIVAGLAIVSLLISGSILAAGKTVPAPTRLVTAHRVGMAVVILAALGGIVCILLGI